MDCPPRTSLFSQVRKWSEQDPKTFRLFINSLGKFLLKNTRDENSPRGSQEFKNYVLNLVTQKKGDIPILKDIAKKYASLGIKKKGSEEEGLKSELGTPISEGPDTGSKGSTGRAESRVADIRKWLDRIRATIHSYIDVGTSEGKITKAVVQELKLPAEDSYGVDVVDQDQDPAFTFVKIDEEHLLGDFNTNCFDLVTIFQAVHHFGNTKAMLDEIWRVMKPGSLLILREHDVNQEWQVVFLDIVHALYDVVFNPVKSAEKFVKGFVRGFACYRSRQEWTRWFANSGISLVEYDKDKPPDLYFSYYALYTKEGLKGILGGVVDDSATSLIEDFL